MINIPLPVISPLVHRRNKHRLLFITRKNPGDPNRTFCNLKPTLTGFFLGLNPMDCCGSTTMRKVPANLIATIFLKICLLSQVTKDSHFEKDFGSHFWYQMWNCCYYFKIFLSLVCQHRNCFWCSLHPFTDWTCFFIAMFLHTLLMHWPVQSSLLPSSFPFIILLPDISRD